MGDGESLYDDGDLYAFMTTDGTLEMGLRQGIDGSGPVGYSIPVTPATVLFAQVLRGQDRNTKRLSLSVALLALCEDAVRPA